MNRPWNTERIFAAAEIACLSGLYWLAIWVPSSSGVTAWTVGAVLSFFITIALSMAWRERILKASGFRIDHTHSAVGSVNWFSVIAVIVVATVAASVGFSWLSPSRVLRYLLFGVFQQVLVLGYFYHRWATVLPNLAAAAIANSVWFGLAHLPDATLACLAVAGELCFTWLYLRVSNVLVIGLVHGMLAPVMLPFLVYIGAIETPRVGPPSLASFVHIIRETGSDGGRFGICSQVIGSAALGKRRPAKIERVLRVAGGDGTMRESMVNFFGRDQLTICITTEREFHRYLDPATQERLAIIGERYIWRKFTNSPHFFDRDPLLGFFRDRALLVTNRAPG
jgi:hypothetical protein